MFGNVVVPKRVYYNLQSAGQTLIDGLIFSSVYLSIAACAMAYVSCTLQKIPFTPALFAIAFCVTFSIYNMNRKTDEQEDQINHSTRYAFTKKYQKLLFWSSIFGYGLTIIISGFAGITAVLITAFPLICGILYSVPLLPEAFRYRRLKEIPLVKNLITTIAWTLPPTLLPVALSSIQISPMTWVAGLFFFTLVFINTVIFDLRDIEGDAAAGIMTIAVMLGAKKTKLFLIAVNLLLGITVVVLSVNTEPVWLSAILALGIIYGLFYVLSFQKIDLGHVMCDFVADGQFIGIAMIIFLYGWLALP